MKNLYLNGLSKMMLSMYGAAVIFGPPMLAQFVAGSTNQEVRSEAVTRAIWLGGTIYVFCVSPFVLSLITRKWRNLIIEIVSK